MPVHIDQHQPGSGDRQQLHAGLGEVVEQIDDVEVRDQGIGEGDQHVGQPLLALTV